MRKVLFSAFVFSLLFIFGPENELVVAESAQATYKINHRTNFLFIGVDCYTKENEKDTFVEEIEIFEKDMLRSYKALSPKFDSRSLYGKDCTRENCLKGFDWIVENSDSNDLSIVYIGTHGRNRKELGGYAFVGYDKIAVNGSEIIDKLKHVKGKLILIVDTCKAGAMVDEWKDCGPNVLIICSCNNSESTYCWKLTVAIRDSLVKSDMNNDGEIDTGEIRKYIPNIVKELTKEQTVTMSQDFPMIVVGGRLQSTSKP